MIVKVDSLGTGFEISLDEEKYDSHIRIIDDTDQGAYMKYYGNWKHSTNTGVVGPAEGGGDCNCSYSQSINDSLVYRFTDATRFEWWGERMPQHGPVDIYLDNKFMLTIDTYSAAPVTPALNWFIDDLDPDKEYRFVLVARENTSVVNQFFQVYNIPKTIPVDCPDCPIIPADTIIYIPAKLIEFIQSGRFIIAD
jgi:hypothetical protein